MNRCWQVARTYLGRWRFWIFGGAYAWVALWVVPTYWSPRRPEPDLVWISTGLIISMVLACVFGCLAALQLRRLLSGPPAHVVPGFWGPHLLVGAVVSLTIWVVLPSAAAHFAGLSPLRIVALNSLAGIVPALVLLWPRAIFLLSLIPVLLVWAATERPGSALLARFFDGEEPGISIAAIVLGVIAYPIAAFVFWRTRDRAATFSDDLVVDRTHEIASLWKQPLLQLRDATIDWQLSGTRRFAWPWRRWRIPCAASWTEIGLLVTLVIAVVAATSLATGDPGVSIFMASVASIVVLFMPLGSWRFRCAALDGECMRPVTRPQFVRQFMSAMLRDFCVWTEVSILITALGYLPTIWLHESDAVWILAMHASVMVSVAVLLYGAVLATIRLRYWMPWFLGLLFGSLIAGGYLAGALVYWWVKIMKFRSFPTLQFGFVLAVFGGIGLLLIAFTYRRWLRADIA